MDRHRRAFKLAGVGTPQQQALGQTPLLQRGLPLLVQRVNLQRDGRAAQLVHLQQFNAQPRRHLPQDLHHDGRLAQRAGCVRALQQRGPRLLPLGERSARGLLGRLVPALGVQHHRLSGGGREHNSPAGVPLHQRLVLGVPGLLATDGHPPQLLHLCRPQGAHQRLLLHHRP